MREIRGYEAATRIANALDFIKGIISLCGIIVPITDTRMRFNLGTPTYDELTVVIVLMIAGRFIGMVVDLVSDVITLRPEKIKPASGMDTALNTDYLIGLGTIEAPILILIDIYHLISSHEIGLIEKMAA